ncbi:Ig-like domain-containing protein [Cupriavidus sp. 30B13]|uniref:Ig-like domain-containing protein n=1 Tax=Cupriavidus sp. 30B13 TaxID=3384241 RepID=UPI003B916B2F
MKNLKSHDGTIAGPGLRTDKSATGLGGLGRFMAVLAIALAAGCGGGSSGNNNNAPGNPDQGGTPGATRPTVTLAVPAPGATGVGTNTKVVATFSKDMNPASLTAASFTVTGPGAAPVAGSVTYVASAKSAAFVPAAALPAATLLTATVTTGASDLAGNALLGNFVWTFTTGSAPDTTRPTVSLSVPAAGAANVATNTNIAVTFSKDMDPATISGTSFTLTGAGGAPVAGTVSYAAGAKSAIFTPGAPLAAGTAFNGTVTTAAADLAGNALAGNFTWTFTTGAGADTTPPTVVSTNPANLATGICTNKSVNFTFSEAMDPLTLNTATFTLTTSAAPAALLPGVVTYDVPGKVATFTPGALTAGTSYIATITTGAKDLAGNALATGAATTFTTNSSTCATAPALGGAAPFGSFGGSATVTNDGLATVINGDLGVNAASTTITGLHDAGGNVYTTTTSNDGTVNGLIYTLTAPPGSVAAAAVTQASIGALAAFNALSPASLPGGIDMSDPAQCASCGGIGDGADELAGRTLPPGVYLSALGTYDIGGVGRTSASLTLDAGGDANAVWVFQTAAGSGTLNVGLTGPATPAVPIQVLLVNGALAKNVFWYVPGGAIIGTGSTMAGTMLANAGITISTTGGTPPSAVVTTLNGRAIALTAGVTMVNTVINVPGQ